MKQIIVVVLNKLLEAVTEILPLLEEKKVTPPPPVTDAPPLTEPPLAKPPVTDAPPLTEPPVTEIEEEDVPELDSEGIPWDVRIHASSKKKLVKDNTWKLIRSIDPITVGQVKTELKNKMDGLDTPPPQTGEISIPQTAGAPDPGPEPEEMTWSQLLDRVTDAQIAGEIVNAACHKFSVDNIGKLQDTPILIPMVAEELGLL